MKITFENNQSAYIKLNDSDRHLAWDITKALLSREYDEPWFEVRIMNDQDVIVIREWALPNFDLIWDTVLNALYNSPYYINKK